MNVLVTTAPIHDEAGRVVSVMEMSTDITEVRELESQLTSLGLLIGSVSHGLKGLLNGLSGGMYLMNTGFHRSDDARVEKGWELIQRNVGRIRSMVSDILYYAKDRELNWETISAKDLAEAIKSLIEPRAGELEIPLLTTVAPHTGDFEGDRQAVRSMLVNLLENSIDACRLDHKKSAHQICLNLKGNEHEVLFEITDNGIGMDQETCDKAFSLFFSSKGSGGTGLGLFISNRIAKAHGGQISVESKLGEGSRFRVRIPRQQSGQP